VCVCLSGTGKTVTVIALCLASKVLLGTLHPPRTERPLNNLANPNIIYIYIYIYINAHHVKDRDWSSLLWTPPSATAWLNSAIKYKLPKNFIRLKLKISIKLIVNYTHKIYIYQKTTPLLPKFPSKTKTFIKVLNILKRIFPIPQYLSGKRKKRDFLNISLLVITARIWGST